MNTPSFKNTFLIFIITIFSLSCRDSVIDEFDIYPGLDINDISWSNKPIDVSKTISLTQLLKLAGTTNSFDANVGGIFNISNDIQIAMPVNSYQSLAGTTLINGSISVQVVPIKKKGDYIRYLIPTETTTNIQEASSNSFYIKLLNSSQEEIKLAPASFINIKFKDTNSSSLHKFYYGDLNGNNNAPFFWKEGTSSTIGSVLPKSNLPINSFGSKQGYEMLTNKTNFVSCSKSLNTGTTSTAHVILPANFTNKNTLVFAVFKNNNSVVRLIPDSISRTFFYEKMPVGLTVNFVSISLIDSKIYLGSQETNIYNSQSYKVKPRLNPISENELISFLDSL